MSRDLRVEPFTVAIGEEVLADLRERLSRTRWPDPSREVDWADGPDPSFLRELVEEWAEWTGPGWTRRQQQLNELTHLRVTVDGLAVHLVQEPGRGPDPLPLLLTHGWPSSFLEYAELIPLLTEPGQHGGDPEDAFTVIAPSLPGYGLSDRPHARLTNAEIADMWVRVMVEALGYDRFGAHGSDIGAGVTARLGQRHSERLVGIHLSAASMATPPQPWTPAEQKYLAWADAWDAEDGGYAHVHSTRPQTLGYGLTDSPVGLAAWLVEKFRDWSGSGGDPWRLGHDWILSTLTVYWATATITSSARLYYEHRRHGVALPAGKPMEVPAGFAIFGHEHRPMPSPPRELAERFFTVARWEQMPRGGHFPAVEEPQLLAEELRAFFRPFRART